MKKITSVALAATLATSILTPMTVDAAKSKTEYKVKNGKLVDQKGKKVKGYATYNGNLYKNGKKFMGIYKKKFYKNGKLTSGTYKGIKYRKGIVFTGKSLVDGKVYNGGAAVNNVMVNGVFYVDGKPFSGSLEDKEYVNGVLVEKVEETPQETPQEAPEEVADTPSNDTPNSPDTSNSDSAVSPPSSQGDSNANVDNNSNINENQNPPVVTPTIPNVKPEENTSTKPNVDVTYTLVEGNLYIDKKGVYYLKTKSGAYDVVTKPYEMEVEDKVLLFTNQGELDYAMTTEQYHSYYMSDILLSFFTDDKSSLLDVYRWTVDKQEIFDYIDKVPEGKYKNSLIASTEKAQEVYDRTWVEYYNEVEESTKRWKIGLVENLQNPEKYDDLIAALNRELNPLELGRDPHPFREFVKQLEIDYPDAKVFNRDKTDDTNVSAPSEDGAEDVTDENTIKEDEQEVVIPPTDIETDSSTDPVIDPTEEV